MNRRPIYSLASYWRWALGCFILAGATGVLFRAGMAAGGLPLALDFADVRRAHSHLMFFSWVSPALMALIAHRICRRTSTRYGRTLEVILAANLLLGLASFVPFLLDGYQTTAVFGVDLPLSIVFSTASMFGWYAFAWWYWRRRRGLAGTTAVVLWDVSIAALVISSAGAWARGMLMGMGVDDPFLTDGVVHFFLGLFSDGWLAVGALGLIHDHLAVEMRGRRRWATGLIVVGLPVTFLLGMPRDVVPAPLWTMGTVGGFLAGLGFLGHTVLLWQSRRRGGMWTVALGALGLKGLANVLFIAPPVAAWAEASGLRLVYLHVLFLGFVTVALVESARLSWRRVDADHSRLMQAAIAVLLVTMVPTTGLWPAGFGGRATMWVVAAGGLAPVIVATWIFLETSSDDADIEQAGPPGRRSRLDGRPDGSP